MKKILCIFLSLVLLVLSLTGFTNAEAVVEDVPLIPIPGVQGSDDLNEDVVYPPTAPKNVAIQRWRIPDALFNSNDDMYRFISSDLGITKESIQQEKLSVQNKFYVDNFYGANGRNHYHPSVVITNQEQLDCFFAWYCNPQQLDLEGNAHREEILKALDFYAESTYRKLSAVDYAESTVIILTMDYRIDGLILQDNALLCLANGTTVNARESSYTYFYVVSNQELPENRENLVPVRAIYFETDRGEVLFNPLWCSIEPDTFCFVEVDQNTKIKPIQFLDEYEELLPQWIEITGAEKAYEKLFGNSQYVLKADNRSALPWYEVEISKKDIESSIEFDVLASFGDSQYEHTQPFGGSFMDESYVATTKEEALALVKMYNGSVLSGDGYKLYQKIQEIDFSKKAIICVNVPLVERGKDEYGINFEYKFNEMQLKSISITDNRVVVKMQVLDSILPKVNPTLSDVGGETGWHARYRLESTGSKYLLVVNKADLPNDLVKNDILRVFEYDNEFSENDYVIGLASHGKVSFEELTEKDILELKRKDIYASYCEWVEKNKK